MKEEYHTEDYLSVNTAEYYACSIMWIIEKMIFEEYHDVEDEAMVGNINH